MSYLPVHATQAAALWSGALILWLMILAIVVISRRRKHKVLFGDGGNPEMTTATRAFGNAAEYSAPAIGALILLAMLGIPAIWINGVGATLFVGRVIHAWGLLFLKGPSVGRLLGMVLTFGALILAAGMLIVHSLV